MASVTALPVQPVAPATHTRMAILHAPFSCPSSLLDSTTFSGGLSTQLPSLFYRLSNASGILTLWVDLLPPLYLHERSGKVVLERSEVGKSCLRHYVTSFAEGTKFARDIFCQKRQKMRVTSFVRDAHI